jgi:hypothetical protein
VIQVLPARFVLIVAVRSMDAENTHDAQIAVLESQTSFLIPCPRQ